jgi:hypothetical protein
MTQSKYEAHRNEIIETAKANDFRVRTTAKIIAKKYDLSTEGLRKFVIKVVKGLSQVTTDLNSRGISSEMFTHGWIKTKDGSYFIKNGNSIIAIQDAIDEMKADIVPYQPQQFNNPTGLDTNLINQYTLTDFHLGMMAWGEETGADWDTKIAEETLIKYFQIAIELSPKSEKAIFAQIGDFLHWDGLDAVTPQNRHLLDADTRFTKLVRVAIRVIRQVITMLLEKHQTVYVIMAEGNHDTASSVWLREMLASFYADEPRLIIDTNPDPYYCITFGKVALFYHHSHLSGVQKLDTVLVSKFKKEFGVSEFVYAHTGHLHHLKQLETNLMVIEQHRTLASKDAYSSRGGWGSGRDSKVITYHKDFGEVARNTINFAML